MFGATKESENELSGSFQEEFTMSETGKYRLRFLSRPVRADKSFIPVQVNDPEQGLIQSYRTLLVPQRQEGSLLGLFSAIDKKIKRECGWDEKEITSVFDPSRKIAFLVIDKDADSQEVMPGLFTWTIYEALRSLQTTESDIKKGYLQYGLWFMYDVNAYREYDKSKGDIQHGTSYRVDVDNSQNEWAHRCPSKFLPKRDGLPEGFDPLDSEYFKSKKLPQVFDSTDRGLILKFVGEKGLSSSSRLNDWLVDNYRAVTPEEIVTFFEQYQLDLTANGKNGQPKFPDPEAFVHAITSHPQLQGYEIRMISAPASKSGYTGQRGRRVEEQEAEVEDGEFEQVAEEDQLSESDNEWAVDDADDDPMEFPPKEKKKPAVPKKSDAKKSGLAARVSAEEESKKESKKEKEKPKQYDPQTQSGDPIW